MMLFLAVRYAVPRKRSRSHSDSSISSATEDIMHCVANDNVGQPLTTADSHQVTLYDLILTISQARRSVGEITIEAARNLVAKPVSLVC